MKQLQFLIFVLLVGFAPIMPIYGCNVCGCGSGASYLGILPQYRINYLGTRFGFKSYYYSEKLPSTIGTGVLKTESYFTTEAWGRYFVSPKVQLMAFVPYNINIRTEETRTKTINGLGDISMFVGYNIIDRQADSLRYQQALLLLAGVKLPNGKYQQRDVNQVMFAESFQVGSGSYAMQLNAIYTIRHNQWGFNIDAGVKHSIENELFFTPGTQITQSATAFYWAQASPKTIWLPMLGLYNEYIDNPKRFSTKLQNLQTNNLFITLGSDIYRNQKHAISVQGQIPLYSKTAINLPVASGRLWISLGMFL